MELYQNNADKVQKTEDPAAKNALAK